MLTIFSTPKPFRGHSDLIQRNALNSWKLLDPNAEVILFGDEHGASEVCAELGLRHEPEVRRSEAGTKYLNFLFERAQNLASHDIVCYSNCDIMLTSAFRRAVQKVAARGKPFLMVGRRTDVDITERWDFRDPVWEQALELRAQTSGLLQNEYFADYFAFSRGLYRNLPPLVIGRIFWDNWLIWKALDSGALVVDASRVVTAVHQNHDHGYHPSGTAGVWNDAQSLANKKLAGNGRHLRTIDVANYILTPQGLQPYPLARARKKLRPLWYKALNASLPVRRALGLNKKGLSRLKVLTSPKQPSH